MSPRDRSPLDDHELSDPSDLLNALLADGLVVAATAIVADPRSILFEESVGADPGPGESVEAARFDLASITKPFTATVALKLDEDGSLPLATTVESVWGRVAEPLRSVTMADLLRHRGGFRAWAPLYHLCKEPAEVAPLLLAGTLSGAETETYSDLGYILWGLTAERALARPLTGLYAEYVGPLSPASTLGSASISDAPLHLCNLDTDVEQDLAVELGLSIPLLGPPKLGQAQDGNARFLGGFGSHAGLFGTARDLLALGRCWISDELEPSGAKPEIAASGHRAYGLGWARRQASKNAGETLAETAFGHIGFTGSSLWIDPAADRILVLAAHRASTGVDLSPWRRAFHDMALRE